MKHACGCPTEHPITDAERHRQYHQRVMEQGGPAEVVNARTMQQARGVASGPVAARSTARPPSFLEWRRLVWQVIRRQAESTGRFTTADVIDAVGPAPEGRSTLVTVEGLLMTACHDHRVLTHYATGDWEGIAPTRPARARTTDPATSHAAAASLSLEGLRLSQRSVLDCLTQLRSGTDEAIASAYRVGWEQNGWPRQSVSGLRTRRSELVGAFLVVDTGRTEQLPSGRASTVWGIA